MKAMKLLFWILFCQLPAIIGGSAAAENLGWYQSLNAPSFLPPAWLFAPVWTILYILMGGAIFLITQNGLNKENRPAVLVFIVQLALNALWVPVFFVRHDVGLALILMLAILASAGWTFQLFWKHAKLAGGLLIPYLLWLIYATFLYGFIWHLN